MKKLQRSLVLFALALCACTPQRNLVYFSNLSELSKSQIRTYESELKIQKNDLLSISVNSLNTESNILFASSTGVADADGNNKRPGFKVNNSGMVTLPVVGSLKVEGLIAAFRRVEEKSVHLLISGEGEQRAALE